MGLESKCYGESLFSRKEAPKAQKSAEPFELLVLLCG
jgi:hypothetical protein